MSNKTRICLSIIDIESIQLLFFRLYWEKFDVYSREMVQMGVAAFKSVGLHFRLQGS